MISGIQVSSFRPMLTSADRMRDTFRKIRKMGCDTVQLQWIAPEISPEEIAEAMREEGIHSVSTQDFFETVVEKKEYFIRLNQLSGGEWICVSGIPEKYMTQKGLRQFVKYMKEFQSELKDSGLKLCFHPRAVDFRIIERKDPVEFLAEQMPESFMLCLDLYHVNHAGLSMAETVRKYRGKICMVHFKDYIRDEKGERLVPAGQGVTEWAETVRECINTSVTYGFVEQEQWDGDAFICLKEAYDWLGTAIMEHGE